MRLKYWLSIPILLAIALFVGADRVMSQGIVTGSLGGTVQDPTSAVIQGATVTATQVGTNTVSKTTTGPTGAFQLPGLPVGTYKVSVEAPGFVAVNVENVLNRRYNEVVGYPALKANFRAGVRFRIGGE